MIYDDIKEERQREVEEGQEIFRDIYEGRRTSRENERESDRDTAGKTCFRQRTCTHWGKPQFST